MPDNLLPFLQVPSSQDRQFYGSRIAVFFNICQSLFYYCYKGVMQLRHDEKILDERFASMRELHRRGKTPDPEHYEVTYYADLPAMWQDVPNNEILEELFQVFNLSRPQDFEGHSLSVSDVIALKRNGEVSVHYVDSIGFKDLQGFLDKQPERPSVLMNLKEKCDAPECNPTVCRKARGAHEL